MGERAGEIGAGRALGLVAAAELMIAGCTGGGTVQADQTPTSRETTMVTAVCSFGAHKAGLEVDDHGNTSTAGAYDIDYLVFPDGRQANLYDPGHLASPFSAPKEERQDPVDRTMDTIIDLHYNSLFRLTLNGAGEVTGAEPLSDHPMTLQEFAETCNIDNTSMSEDESEPYPAVPPASPTPVAQPS